MYAMLTSAVDSKHSIPFSVTLTLAGGHKVSKNQNLLASFFVHFTADQNEI